MRRSMYLALSAIAAAVVTHGMIFSGLQFHNGQAVSGYQGFFQQVLLGVERLWSFTHGWQPLSHLRDFAGFYAGVVHVLCPLLGFGLFRMVSRSRFGADLWKPLSIALLCALVPTASSVWVEVARTVLILLAMVSLSGPVLRRSVALP
jgi:hypothetical protein